MLIKLMKKNTEIKFNTSNDAHSLLNVELTTIQTNNQI